MMERRKRGLTPILCVAILIALFGGSRGICNAQRAASYYSVQLGSFSQIDNAKSYYDSLKGPQQQDYLANLRVELLGDRYTLLVGMFETKPEAQHVQEIIQTLFPDAFIINIDHDPKRIVYGSGAPTGAQASAKAPAKTGRTASAPAEPVAPAPVTDARSDAMSPEPAAQGAMPSDADLFPESSDAASRLAESSRGLRILGFPVAYIVGLVLGMLVLLSIILKFKSGPSGRRRRKSNLVRLAANNGFDKKLVRNRKELSMIEGNLLSIRKNVRTIYVSSCFGGEGKTTAAIQLAYGLSMNRSARVLLIDGNTSAPVINQIFNTKSAPGYAEFLADKANIKSVISKTKYPNLYFMPHGAAKEDEFNLLNRKRGKQHLDQLAGMFNFIIFDGDSTMQSAEAPLIASMFDGVIITVECERTKWEVVRMATEKYHLLGGNVLGVVLNKRKFYIPRFLYGKV